MDAVEGEQPEDESSGLLGFQMRQQSLWNPESKRSPSKYQQSFSV